MISSKKGQEMYLSVTPMYENSKLMLSILNAIGTEADMSVELGDEILRQLFPQTADSWGLSIWEQRLGLATNISESIERRRKKVIAKFQTKFIITPERMAFIIKNYTGIEPLIEENVAPYTFDVYLKTYTMFSDILSDVHNVIKTIKPSHLAYNLIMQYVTKVIIRLSSKEWVSDTIPPCGTLDDSGNTVVATDGILYSDEIKDSLIKYFSNTLLQTSQKVYPIGSLGKSFGESIHDLKDIHFSNTLRIASDNNFTYMSDGIMKNEKIIDKCSMYSSINILQCSNNIYCGGGVYA